MGCALGLLGAVAQAAVEGRVVSSSERAVPQALVTVVGTGVEVRTGNDGTFRLPDTSPPCRLLVTHPRFTTAEIEIEGDQSVTIRLTAKQTVYEEVVVSADRSGEGLGSVSVASTTVHPEDRVEAPSDLGEVVADVPGAAENGQGGRLQSYSVRGVSGQRLLSLLSGIPIVTERRAGASLSFVDPALIDSLDVVRGPSSTHYGSGALGGVVQAFPRRFDGFWLQAGLDSQGLENHQVLGWGREDLSVGVSRRDSDDGTDGDGGDLNDQFTQYNATLWKRWAFGERSLQLTLLPSVARDIGKSNTDHPEKTTIYPEEDHLLLKLQLEGPAWLAYVYAHPNDLLTHKETLDGEESEVDNEALDVGAAWQYQRAVTRSWTSFLGLDWFARRDVTATERDVDGTRQTLDGAEQDEAAAWATVRYRPGALALQAGGRVTWQRQDNAGWSANSRTEGSGFLGLVWEGPTGWELLANAGTGLRFPSLTERFYTGITGRGDVVGNPDLEPERSLNFDVGARWFGGRMFLEGYAFVNKIDRYIEQVDIDEDTTTFENLTSGRITGLELEGFYQADRLQLTWGGHLQRGRDDDGAPLADIPPWRVSLGTRFDLGTWKLAGRWEHRGEKDDPGPGEKPIPAVDLVSLSAAWDLPADLTLTLEAGNLLDDAYFPSADRKAALAPGRSVGLTITWKLP